MAVEALRALASQAPEIDPGDFIAEFAQLAVEENNTGHSLDESEN